MKRAAIATPATLESRDLEELQRLASLKRHNRHTVFTPRRVIHVPNRNQLSIGRNKRAYRESVGQLRGIAAIDRHLPDGWDTGRIILIKHPFTIWRAGRQILHVATCKLFLVRTVHIHSPDSTRPTSIGGKHNIATRTN